MTMMLADIRYGARILRKKPGFTLLAVLTLALGVGATTAIFSVVDAVLLRPLPYLQPSKLVGFIDGSSSVGFSRAGLSDAEYVKYRAENQSFTDVAAWVDREVVMRDAGEPERLRAPRVSYNYFRTLGVNLALGREFSLEEELPGKGNVVVLSEEFWRRRFGADPAILGRSIRLENNSVVIIGVAPASFKSPSELQSGVPVDVWRITELNPASPARGSQYLTVIGRLKPGVEIAAAQAESQINTRRIAQENPDYYPPDMTNSLEPFDRYLNGDVRRPIFILLAAVAVLLLIACVNVANLLLARGEERQREIAVRTALGATRRAIITQLLIESLLLAALGGAAGVLLAYWGLDVLLSIGPKDIPRLSETSLHPGVIGFAFALSALTAMLFGLAPALQTLKFDLHATLKDGGRSGGQLGRSRLRSALVALETAMAVVLLIGAGLLIRSYWKLQQVDAGFQPDHVLTMQLSPPAASYREPALVTALYERALARVAALPGVESAALTDPLALSGDANNTVIEIEGRPLDMNRLTNMLSDFRVVSPGYNQAMGIRLLQGRLLSDADREGTTAVVVVNETFARNHWSGENPMGKRFRLLDAPPATATSRFMTIVGVIADVKNESLGSVVRQEASVPLAQHAVSLGGMSARQSFSLVVRTKGDPTNLAQTIAQNLRDIERGFLILNVRTMESILNAGFARPRFNLSLLGLFAVLALGLGAVGIYGVISYLVAQRTHEIGVRMALGAQSADVLRLVLRQGMRLALAGVGIGLIGALALTPLMKHMLFGVEAFDPLTFFLIPVVLLGVALAACLGPARRAARVDPMVALRWD